MFLISLHRLGSESLTRVEAHKKAVHYQRSHLTWERRTSQSIVVSFNLWERACHPLGIGKKDRRGIASGGQNRRKILNCGQDFESRSSSFLPPQLLREARLPLPSQWTPSSSTCPSLSFFLSFFLLSFFSFPLPADSEFWLAPDHHFTVPRERSQRRLFFPPFTKQAALNYSVFLDLPLACPSGIFIRESQSQHCRPS